MPIATFLNFYWHFIIRRYIVDAVNFKKCDKAC